MPCLYLAGPCGFTELTRKGIEDLEPFLRRFFQVFNPFAENQALGQQLVHLEREALQLQSSISLPTLQHQSRQLLLQIGAQNQRLLDRSDIILAVLDGPDVDSGTASEIGYAFAKGKTIWGYRNDLRRSGDGWGVCVNLQLEFFIQQSGGQIFPSLQALSEFIAAHFQPLPA